MKRLILISTLFLLLNSCKDSTLTTAGILTQEQMIPIITDLHIAEAKVQNMAFKHQDSSYSMYVKLEAEILKKYNVSKTVYDSSFNYYSKNLNLLNEIYEKSIDSLNLKNTKNSDL